MRTPLRKIGFQNSAAILSLLWATLQAAPAFAQLQPTAPITDPSDIFTKVLCGAVFWVYTFALVFGIIEILLAGYKFMTSGGDENEVSTARKMLLYGAIGIAVALIADGVPSIVSVIIGGNAMAQIC